MIMFHPYIFPFGVLRTNGRKKSWQCGMGMGGGGNGNQNGHLHCLRWLVF